MAVILASLPILNRIIPNVPVVCIVTIGEVAPNIEVGARHILPVIWLRVLGVVVVQLGALVHRVFAIYRGGELQLVVDVPVPCCDGRRSEVVDNARVALMTILIAPVRVVVIVVGEPVSLVGRSTLGRALGRVAPGRETQGVTIVPLLLNSEEVRQGVVVCTLYIATVSPAIGKTRSDSPSTIVEATAISVHATERVVAVGGSYRSVVAYLHASGTEIIVIATSHSRHGVVVSLERKGKVNVAGETVQTADIGESELSAFHVVDWSTIDIDIIVLLVERTVTETHR